MRLFLDQWGNSYFADTIKELCKKVGYSKARKMYVDLKGGGTAHVGYVVGPHWFTEYTRVTRPA
jgi:hypothetical protein